MTSNEDLNKLFEAALGDKQAPSRYGTPEEQRKFSPVPVLNNAPAPVQGSRFQASPAEQASTPQPAVESDLKTSPAPATQASPATQEDFVSLDQKGLASLDTGISAELGAIMDAKVARQKRKRRRGLLLIALFFTGTVGGTAGWVVTNPERFEAMKKVVAEIKSAGDIKGMVAKYQKALDKIAVRGEQIDAATTSMGIDPASADHMEDQGFDKEMREMMGEDGGPTTASRNSKLMEKFKHVKEGGSLIKKSDESPATE